MYEFMYIVCFTENRNLYTDSYVFITGGNNLVKVDFNHILSFSQRIIIYSVYHFFTKCVNKVNIDRSAKNVAKEIRHGKYMHIEHL